MHLTFAENGGNFFALVHVRRSKTLEDDVNSGGEDNPTGSGSPFVMIKSSNAISSKLWRERKKKKHEELELEVQTLRRELKEMNIEFTALKSKYTFTSSLLENYKKSHTHMLKILEDITPLSDTPTAAANSWSLDPPPAVSPGQPHAVSLGLPHAVSPGQPHAGLPHAVSPGQPHAVSLGLPHAVSLGLPHAVSPGLSHAVSPGLLHAMPHPTMSCEQRGVCGIKDILQGSSDLFELPDCFQKKCPLVKKIRESSSKSSPPPLG